MEADQERDDPILIGAPVGVFISESEDPSTYFNLCAGQGDPVVDPDVLRERAFGDGHYSACPIYVAGREIRDTERLFAPVDRASRAPTWGEELAITDAEARFDA